MEEWMQRLAQVEAHIWKSLDIASPHRLGELEEALLRAIRELIELKREFGPYGASSCGAPWDPD